METEISQENYIQQTSITKNQTHNKQELNPDCIVKSLQSATKLL